MSVAGTHRTLTPSVRLSNTKGHNHDTVKVRKPNMYYGKCEGLNDWLNQLDLYYLFNSTLNNQTTLIATTYMRDRAQY